MILRHPSRLVYTKYRIGGVFLLAGTTLTGQNGSTGQTVNFANYRCQPAMIFWSASSAREAVDFTVPFEMPVASAISASDRSP